MSFQTPARNYAKGIGDAVADRTVNRKITRPVSPYSKTIEIPRRDDMALDHEVDEWCRSNHLVIESYEVTYGDDLIVRVNLSVIGHIEVEKWEDVAHRVATGSAMLHPQANGSKMMDVARQRQAEFDRMHHHLRQASVLMSGRHLQHGDSAQPSRNMEVFTNCSTAASTFLTFYLLLNGSGVGRSYDNEMIVADFNSLPVTVCVIDMMHKDCQSGEINALDMRTARHLYAGRDIEVFEVPDSREGWAKALEKMEYMAYRGDKRNSVLLLDFSKVRPRGAPIAGMQNRPASGPGPMMTALSNVAKLRDAGMAPWRAAMYADHYVAECVLVGGARRAARMATKTWRDKNVLDFIQVKRGGFLWSSNNSVTVDGEFWKLVGADLDEVARYESAETLALAHHAQAVFNAICEAAYFDGTGEPGLINVDKLTWNGEGVETLADGNFAESERYKLDTETLGLTAALAKAWNGSRYKVITNPCGEIVLGALGGYCVIADVVPYHAASTRTTDAEVSNADWDNDAEDAFRTATRALIRTNLMDSLYGKEVKRTNRIGVGITGLHEYAWARFGYGWKDIVDEDKSKDFWLTLSRFKRAVQDEAKSYSEFLGVTVPHTNTTIKPAGCASLDTAIKTTEGVLTMRELFAKHGVTEDDLRGMEDGTWIEPKVKTLVLDEGNVEREVTKLYLNGVKPVYEIEFEDGTVVKLTGNHKLKTVAGEWKRVDELTDADEILQF